MAFINPEFRMFFLTWLRAPRQIASAVPSGRPLAELMAAQVPAGPGLVVEVGAGTGVITAALLARGVDPRELVLVERDPAMARWLRQKFPQVQVLCADAGRLRAALAAAGRDEPVRAVVSGLPLLAMERPVRYRIVSECWRALAPVGCMVQFTYGPLSPVPERMLGALGLHARRAGHIWNNLPPAFVWRYEREAVAAQPDAA